MSAFSLLAFLLTVASLFGIINNRFVRLPSSVGMMLIAMLTSGVILLLDRIAPSYGMAVHFRDMMAVVDLPHTLLDGALSFLLFAGALQLDLPLLWDRKWPVLALAVPGTLLSILLFSLPIWLVFHLADIDNLPFVWCVALGAILAPTDPVSVLSMLRRAGLPPPLQAVFAGESLFNDGVAVVIFSTALALGIGDGGAFKGIDIVFKFLVEAVGGAVLGLSAGWAVVWLLRWADEISLELLLSLALASGTYSLAESIHLSGPIACVFAALVLATSHGRRALAAPHRRDMMQFWILTEEILNALLFLLIGFELISVSFSAAEMLVALCAIPLALAARGGSVLIATIGVRVPVKRRFPALALLTWGGLRGGVSVAMALGVPDVPYRGPMLAVCYGVVVFTIVVQGLTTERLAKYLYRDDGNDLVEKGL